MTAPAFSLAGVTLRVGGRDILRNATFESRTGQFVALLGPNGAGKTTLLRALVGLVPTRTGQIRVLGASPRAARGRVGYMPQARALTVPSLSGADYLRAALHGARWGLTLRRDTHEIDRVLDLVSARDIAPRPIGTLSGGERQRLALAQALLGRPELLLLDEPLASLDPARVGDVVALTRDLRDALGLTVLFCAHDINPLIGTADAVLYVANATARLGPVEAVITTESLSALYGVPVEVVRARGHVFVMAGTVPAAGGECCAHG
ncbi:Mn2+/Zn2+ transporter ATP-binding protein [Ameyamaea chiangmaiensis NBRC 103196]|uniref:ATP-binding cassette domain-containing protein n=1 Tax=Ameyamaea chiangmaiensis TaxID=442969 RepID=A0A850PCR4_9PROT|nr:ATP-binding cassette domain-containing protein [Ameyamaea chiangmaiensis]MBS4074926.1 ATP-binding cassette domain-containing protein [Ameyamaea chiangmaiensis]NVN41924.1 ATP-binding cassette domain-containing protein [Ameyamaea chiangmaiensis]GBQ63226.1 Mn2+/Zn2+ transporter ATP-binding protein [Ameyamaea chiangmaiensis NBRC 103196]